ncbi:MAG: PCMD domain-containing protein [Bacteroidales bacterium]|nr:PCMD domain-containing protein [Bacteroidales bacterium]
MKLKYLIACLLAGTLTFISCIKDEAPNAEADILKCTLPDGIMTSTEIDYTRPFDESLNAYPLTIEVQAGTDLTALSPQFELTPGATIEPESGSTHDFTNAVRYTVTSEDKQWHRTYSVSIRHPESQDIPTVYHFETVTQSGNYHIFYEQAADHTTLTWDSGNQGFALTGGGNVPEDYPTFLNTNGMVGNCLQLITRETGSLGQQVNKPIASGNLFIGRFELINALGDALAATKFGTAFYHKPTMLTGYYKYQAGPKFYENGTYTDRKDNFSIYAIFFEKTDQVQYMDGYLKTNNFQHDNMVALALMTDAHETNEWTRFEIPFDYARYGKEVDETKLRNGQYCIGIVFASSEDGDLFLGAPDSTLLIDEVELKYE